jgi:hypothetical protein
VPVVSGNVGAVFSGGTINEGLVIADPDATEPQLTISGTAADTTKLIDATAVHTTFTVDSDGAALFSSDDRMTVAVQGTAGTGAVLSVESATNSVVMDADNGTGWNVGGENVASIGPVGINVHKPTAPADADLVAGDCCLWFDSTNGAAKLMVKAKQADGTVKTAAIALT